MTIAFLDSNYTKILHRCSINNISASIQIIKKGGVYVYRIVRLHVYGIWQYKVLIIDKIKKKSFER